MPKPLRRQPPPQAVLLARFWAFVDRRGPEACWNWRGVINDSGYGRFHLTRTDEVRAHRWLYEALNGPLPEGRLLCHTCDNPACVNPRHLFIGSDTDNVRDMVAKGRNSNGRRERTHCPQGHPYSESNTYVSRVGKRYCRTCLLERKRRGRQIRAVAG